MAFLRVSFCFWVFFPPLEHSPTAQTESAATSTVIPALSFSAPIPTVVSDVILNYSRLTSTIKLQGITSSAIVRCVTPTFNGQTLTSTGTFVMRYFHHDWDLFWI